MIVDDNEKNQLDKKVKEFIVTDFDLYEKSVQALVSYVRVKCRIKIKAYKNHKCDLIFQFKELDMNEML